MMFDYWDPPQTRYMAKKRYPEATIIAKVHGGYAGFRTMTDYEFWRNQR